MPLENRIEEKEDKLSAAIKPYLKYYNFTDTDEGVFTLTGTYLDDLYDFHPGDTKDGCTFVGHLFAKDPINTFLDTLLVFKDEDGKYIVGSTVGGMVVPINLKGALN